MVSLISDIQIPLPTISLTTAETNGLKNLPGQARITHAILMLDVFMVLPQLPGIILSFMEDVWGKFEIVQYGITDLQYLTSKRFICSGGETGGPCPSSDSWLFSRVNKKWKRLEECFSPRMFPAMAPLPLGVDKLRYRAVMYGGGQKRPIDDTDEFSVVWVGIVFVYRC
jgi:hypothetical protein